MKNDYKTVLNLQKTYKNNLDNFLTYKMLEKLIENKNKIVLTMENGYKTVTIPTEQPLKLV